MGNPATNAKNKYNKKKYDQFLLTMAKGDKERYRDIAEAEGRSLNYFILQAIEEKISREKSDAIKKT